MYDAIKALAHTIPSNAQAVAGYVDGLYAWTDAEWALFPNALKVRIAVFSTTNDGDVLDSEPGNGTPAQAVDWVLMRRAAGKDPIVYCNELNYSYGLPALRLAFQQRGVPDPHYWVSNYDGIATIPAGLLGKQYTDNPPDNNYDTSVMLDILSSIIDPAPVDPPAIPKDEDMPQQIESLAVKADGQYVYAFPKGAYREVAFVTDEFGPDHASLRVVLWTPPANPDIRTVTVPTGSTVVAFPNAAQTYAVSVTREDSGSHPIGVAFA